MIKVENLSKNYGERRIFSGFSYTFPLKGIVAIVGGMITLSSLIAWSDDWLINAAFDEEKAETKEGEVCTIKTETYTSDKLPFLALVDTRGIERNENYQLKKDFKDEVLEKAGFQFEGILRQNAIKNNKVIDMKMYSLIKEHV